MPTLPLKVQWRAYGENIKPYEGKRETPEPAKYPVGAPGAALEPRGTILPVPEHNVQVRRHCRYPKRNVDNFSFETVACLHLI